MIQYVLHCNIYTPDMYTKICMYEKITTHVNVKPHHCRIKHKHTSQKNKFKGGCEFMCSKHANSFLIVLVSYLDHLS